MHLDHINIRSSKELLEKTKDFYCFILKLREGYRPDFPRNGFWLYANDKPVVHLSESDEYQQTEQTGCFDHAAFQVDELKEIINRLEELGVEYQTNHIQGISMSQVFFRDPTGIRIEVNCFISPEN